MIIITDSVNVLALNLEISALLAKGAIKPVDPLSQLGGFYLTYFLIRNEGNGLRPVLDLSRLNEILRVFLTTKDFLCTVAKGEWFTSVDLKDQPLSISPSLLDCKI